MKVRTPGVRRLRKMIERGNPLFAVTQVTSTATTTDSLKARTQQATQGGMMTKFDLLKSGKLINRWMIERINPAFMGKNYSDNQHSIKNTKDLTMKQMFDISAKLVSEQK